MMLSLISTLLLANNDINNVNDANDANNIDDANDVNDANDFNDVNDTNADDADDERRKKSSIEERKESRLDINLNRVKRLVMCYFFASLTVN
jgi:hypothetical protein